MRGPSPIPARLAGAALATIALAIAGLTGCGGDDDDGASPQSLRSQLPTESVLPGFKSERKFDFDNPIDFAHEGLHLPQSTPLSQAVDALEDAGFEAGVGERLVEGNPFEGASARVNVAEFGSDEDARRALEFVNGEALKQPCFAVCAMEGSEFDVTAIPGAKGVQQTPLPEPPPDAPPPFASYGVGFTVGPRLYLVGVDGHPGEVDKAQAIEVAEALYERSGGSGTGS